MKRTMSDDGCYCSIIAAEIENNGNYSADSDAGFDVDSVDENAVGFVVERNSVLASVVDVNDAVAVVAAFVVVA